MSIKKLAKLRACISLLLTVTSALTCDLNIRPILDVLRLPLPVVDIISMTSFFMYILCCSIIIICSVLSLYGISMSSVFSFEKIHTHFWSTEPDTVSLAVSLPRYRLCLLKNTCCSLRSSWLLSTVGREVL